LGYLPPSRPDHHPALIGAFGIPQEPEPGRLAISSEVVEGVHLTLLRRDGSGKADTVPNKIMVGRSVGWPIVLAPPNEDNERRLQRRLTKLIGASRDEWPADLAYATEWPRLREGGVDAIRDWIKSSDSPALVVVDVLAMVLT